MHAHILEHDIYLDKGTILSNGQVIHRFFHRSAKIHEGNGEDSMGNRRLQNGASGCYFKISQAAPWSLSAGDERCGGRKKNLRIGALARKELRTSMANRLNFIAGRFVL